MDHRIRENILIAAIEISGKNGWHGLSMRKLSDRVHYSVPTIYRYFLNKDEIINEIARSGFLKLIKAMLMAKELNTAPLVQLAQMWRAYADFAKDQNNLYRIMFGVGVLPAPAAAASVKEFNEMVALVKETINSLPEKHQNNDCYTSKLFLTLWAFTHGLATIKLTFKSVPGCLEEPFFSIAIRQFTIVETKLGVVNEQLPKFCSDEI